MHDATPKVSVIMPVYNAAAHLQESIDCILNQFLADFELLCIDDGSTDDSLKILRENAKKDDRICIIEQCHSGAGAARNRGCQQAKGQYIYFFEAEDFCSKDLLQETTEKAEATDADIIAFDFYRFSDETGSQRTTGIHDEWLPAYANTFCYRELPDQFFNSVNPAPWNKLFRGDFLNKNQIQFDELMLANDLAFSAVSMAKADKIAYVKEPFVSHRIETSERLIVENQAHLCDAMNAIQSAAAQLESLPYYEDLKLSFWRFEIDQLYAALKNNISDFSSEEAGSFYGAVNDYLHSAHFEGFEESRLGQEAIAHRLATIRDTDYDTMLQMRSLKVIASLTSYPGRIPYIYPCLDSILHQSHPADQVILWLSREEFPEEKKQLPEQLLSYEDRGLSIRFVDDNLKPHKKYFYAFQEFPDDIVITFDDDVTYSYTSIESLYNCYLRYPHAVSALRTHLMTFREDGSLSPYTEWIQESDGAIYTPSMQLFATGVSGILYPPHTLPEIVLDKEAIQSCCLTADDLWLKAAELYAGVPVVLAKKIALLQSIPGSQENALYYANVRNNENDIQMASITAYYDQKESGVLKDRLQDRTIGTPILTREELYAHMLKLHQNEKAELRAFDRKLKRTYQEKSELNAKLQQTYKEKSELNEKLQQTYREKSEINAEYNRINNRRPITKTKRMVKHMLKK